MNGRAAVLAGAFVVVAACGVGRAPATPSPASLTGETAPTGSITVLAAASLTDVFTRAAADLKTRYPGTDYRFSFGSSSTLATQIVNGAPADVFASADEKNMRTVVDAGLVSGAASVFTANRLQIVVGRGNPKHLAALADLARPDLVVVLAGPTVPVGRYSREALAKAGVTVHPASDEVDVRAVLNKVALGEADAGIVYTTDVLSAGARVTGVDVPDAFQVVARYPIAVVKDATDPRLAQAFIDYLLSAEGRTLLASFGFSSP